MSAKVQVVFYSMYGHVYKLAEAVTAGARELSGGEVTLDGVCQLVEKHLASGHGAERL